MEQRKVIPAGNEWVDKQLQDFTGAPTARIADEWMLIACGDTAEQKGNWNAMTASWGGVGVLWGKQTAFMVIRPTRFTYTLANEHELFSLSFFGASCRRALEICGTASGADTDKAALAGLTPIVFSDGSISFQEAQEVIVCRKMYVHDIDPRGFIDRSIEKHYPGKDYHRMFIGEVLTLRVRK